MAIKSADFRGDAAAVRDPNQPGRIRDSGAMTRSLEQALATGPVTLDGGLATRLEARGNDLSSELWSARLLLDAPREIVGAHRDFFGSGAAVATSATYQASFEGLATLGLDRKAATALMQRGVHLAAQARDEFDDDVERWVATSVGPYGAVLADGSEYRGDYGLSVAQLRDWHRPRLEVLLATVSEGGADILAVETIPCLAEVEALLAEIDGTGVPAWLCISSDGDQTRAGESAAQAFAMAADVAEVIAVGVNCCDSIDVADQVRLAVKESGKPAIAYPNSGEGWDAHNRVWTGSGSFTSEMVDGWLADGARLVGGCCRVTPASVAMIADRLSGIDAGSE